MTLIATVGLSALNVAIASDKKRTVRVSRVPVVIRRVNVHLTVGGVTRDRCRFAVARERKSATGWPEEHAFRALKAKVTWPDLFVVGRRVRGPLGRIVARQRHVTRHARLRPKRVQDAHGMALRRLEETR